MKYLNDMKYLKIEYIIRLFFLLLMACNSKQKSKEEDKLPYFNSYDFTPQWGKEYKTHKIADFKLLNQDGNVVSQKNYKGKIYVVNFFFTSCTGICNTLVKNMSILQGKLAKDSLVALLSHSVTPKIDSVAKLSKYVTYKGLNTENWNLVTGDKDEIYKLARTSYFADADYKETNKPSSFIHSENFLLIDPDGYIRGVYNGTLKLEMNRIVKHISVLKKEFFR